MARIAKVHGLNPLDPPSIVSIHTPPGNKPLPIISDECSIITLEHFSNFLTKVISLASFDTRSLNST